jgi:hypothetical protein
MPTNQWATALQNVFALLVTGYLADKNIIQGNVASVMIMAILGVVAIPAFKSKPPLGIFVVLGAPAVRLAMALVAVKGA